MILNNETGEDKLPMAAGQPDCTTCNDIRQTKFYNSPLFRQTLAAFGSFLCISSAGMTTGFSAVLLPQLEHPNSTLPVTREEASWIASIVAPPMAVGCILSGVLMDKYGRRTVHQLLCLPYILGWVLMAVARNISVLCVGRFITGICGGLIGPLASVYISEISAPTYRGFLLGLVILGVSTGIFLSHLLGTFLSWEVASGISALIPFISFLCIISVAESSPWLAERGKVNEAEKTFFWFRGRDPTAEQEFRALLMRKKEERLKSSAKIRTQTSEFSAMVSKFRKKSFLKPLLVMTGYFLLLQFSGVNAVCFYTVAIIQDLGNGMEKYLATLILDIIRVIASAFALFLMKTCRRRSLTLFSCIGTLVTLILLGIFLSIKSLTDNSSISWIPVAVLMLYICFVSVGVVPLPWAMIGEVFPSSVRGLGSGISSGICFAAMFLVVKTLPDMLEQLGAGGTFFVYSVLTAIGTIFLYFFLPETKDKTLQDIENETRRKPLSTVENADEM